MIYHNPSGEWYPIRFLNLNPSDVRNVMRPTNGWIAEFDWMKYFGIRNVEVYKMVIQGTDDIQGAIAIENREDHVWVHLAESAPLNRIKKTFDFVGEHLFAFACKRSTELGHDGFVAFDSKTALIPHYEKILGAILIGGVRMMITDIAARRLIQVYLT